MFLGTNAMKQRICICICVILVHLIFFNVECTASAYDNINSKLTVYLSGDIIEKVQVNIEFENNDPIVFAVPCKISDYNTKYDNQNFLFDAIFYESYSLCVVAPIGKVSNFNIVISNEHGEIYEGLTVKGTIVNGKYEMSLKIPVIEREERPKNHIYQFSAYSIVQDYQYSSVTYSKDGKKMLTEEVAGEELQLPIPIEKSENIIFTYSMNRTVPEESSIGMTIFLSILIPFIILAIQPLISVDKKTMFNIKNIVFCLLFLIVFIAEIVLYLIFSLPKWTLFLTIAIAIFVIICILINSNSEKWYQWIKKNIIRFPLLQNKEKADKNNK